MYCVDELPAYLHVRAVGHLTRRKCCVLEYIIEALLLDVSRIPIFESNIARERPKSLPSRRGEKHHININPSPLTPPHQEPLVPPQASTCLIDPTI